MKKCKEYSERVKELEDCMEKNEIMFNEMKLELQ